MRSLSHLRQLRGTSGQNLLEFSIGIFLLVTLLLAVFEVGRLLLVYTTVANAAGAGARYAAVHGANAAVTVSQVQNVVRNYLSAAPLDTARAGLIINVTYGGGSNAIGSTVTVQVVYPYDPFTPYLPFTTNLGSTSQGVIAF